MAPPVAVRVCVGDLAVPLSEGTLEIIPDGDAPKVLEILEVDLSSRKGKYEWLERGLGLKAYSFRRLEWPLFEEARSFLLARRAACPRRAGKLPNLGVEVDLRGRRVLVRNNLKRLSVCFEKGTEVEGVGWLIGELEKDLAASAQSQPGSGRPKVAQKASGSSEPSAASAPSIAALEKQVQDKVLEDLRRQPGVISATFCQSREALLVRGNFPDSKERKFFGVPALKRQRQTLEQDGRALGLAEETLQGLYRSAARSALEALGAVRGDDAARSGSNRSSGASASSHSEDDGGL